MGILVPSFSSKLGIGVWMFAIVLGGGGFVEASFVYYVWVNGIIEWTVSRRMQKL
jgi:hypothetical protein